MGVGEPAADGYSVLRVKNVGRGRIVNYDCFSKVTADLREILDKFSNWSSEEKIPVKANLDVVALMVVAAFAE